MGSGDDAQPTALIESATSLDKVRHSKRSLDTTADPSATDFYYLTGFNEPDATVILGEATRRVFSSLVNPQLMGQSLHHPHREVTGIPCSSHLAMRTRHYGAEK